MAERLLSRLPKRMVAKMPAEYLANEAEYWQQREELLADYSGRWIAPDQGQVGRRVPISIEPSSFCCRSLTHFVEKGRRKGGPFCVWQIHLLSDDNGDFF
jgi:hypothetical protein